MARRGGAQRPRGGRRETSKKLAELAPGGRRLAGDSILELAEGYEALAESLGADVDDPESPRTRRASRRRVDAFKRAVAAKPGLTALAVSPADDLLYVANPEYAPELLDFQEWGLDVINPDKPDPGFPYWENLSWENADKYQPDLILWDCRAFDADRQAEWGEKQPTWFSIRAAEAGPVIVVARVLAAHLRPLTPTRWTSSPTRLEALDENVGDWAYVHGARPGAGHGTETTRTRRRGLGLGLVLLRRCVGLVAFLSVTLGARDICLGEVLRAFGDFGSADRQRHGHAGAAGAAHAARLLAGAALGLSGALLQGVTRNPLADPGIMGVNAGAAAAVVAAITLLGVHGVSGPTSGSRSRERSSPPCWCTPSARWVATAPRP